MDNQKSLTLTSGQTIPDRFNSFFAHQFPKAYAGRGRHNQTIKDIPLWITKALQVRAVSLHFVAPIP